MTGFTSSALVVKNTIYQGLKALVGTSLPAGFQVSYGGIGREPEREFLYLGDIKWSSEEWAGMAVGTKPREEQYTIQLVINVQNPNGDDIDSETKLFAYIGVVESYLRTNPFVTYGKVTVCDIVPDNVTTFPIPDNSEAQFMGHIRVMSRI